MVLIRETSYIVKKKRLIECEKEDITELEPVIILSYFHHKIGPMVFTTYPSGVFIEGKSHGVAGLLDQMGSEGFSTASLGNMQVSNYFFEVPSLSDRFSKEFLMLSITLEEKLSPEKEIAITELCRTFAEKVKTEPGISKAFYINDLEEFGDEEKKSIFQTGAQVTIWVKELHTQLITEILPKFISMLRK